MRFIASIFLLSVVFSSAVHSFEDDIPVAIVGGEPAERQAWPFMVAISQKGFTPFFGPNSSFFANFQSDR